MSCGAHVALGIAFVTAVAWAPVARAEPVAVAAHTSLDDVRACAVGERGVVLAGTTGGLAVYGADGALARVLTSLDGLPDTRVHAVLLEGDDAWVGTERGLARAHLEGGAVRVTASMTAPPVRALARQGGELYAGTWGGGVMRVEGAKLVAVPFARSGAEASRVTSLAVWGGELVAGTAGAGLSRLEPASRRLVAFDRARTPPVVWSLAVHDGRLWVGGLDGAVSLPAAGPARFELDADTRAFGHDGAALLVGTWGKGLLRFPERAAVHPVPEGAFVQALDARGGSRCVATRGALFVDGKRAPATGLVDGDLTALARSGERLWVGTYDHGVALFESGRFTRVHGSDTRVNALAIEPGAQERLWVGTARGLTVLGGEHPRTYGGGGELPSSDVHAILPLSGGGVLVGTERGAAIVRGGTIRRIDDKQGLGVRAVWAVAEAPGGALLLGTSTGLWMGAPGGPWKRASVSTGHLPDDWVTALVVRGRDVFVGTYNGGVVRLAIDGEELTAGERLGGGYVNPAGLAIEGDTLYAATMDGLLARPLEAGAWRTLRGATVGRDVTAVLPAGDDLWVASRRGLVRARAALDAARPIRR